MIWIREKVLKRAEFVVSTSALLSTNCLQRSQGEFPVNGGGERTQIVIQTGGNRVESRILKDFLVAECGC